MPKRKPLGLINVAIHLIQAYVNRFIDLTQLASLEARLAVKTLVMIAIMAVVMLVFIASTWGSLQLLFFFYLISLKFTFISASLMLVGLNFIVLLTIGLYIKRIKRHLYFPATRKQLVRMSWAKRGND